MQNSKRSYLEGEDMTRKLEELMRLARGGKLACTALRIFHQDGTWEDIVIGGDENARIQALADLRAAYAGDH